MLAIRTALESNTPTALLLRDFISGDAQDLRFAMTSVVNKVRDSESSRCKTYKDINPTLEIHGVYKQAKLANNDRHRISFTRFRVSGHSLAIEKGRWSRRGRGRLPPEERLCVCGEVQDEWHVVQTCPVTNHLRQAYNFVTLDQLMNSDQFAFDTVCKIIHEILGSY